MLLQARVDLLTSLLDSARPIQQQSNHGDLGLSSATSTPSIPALPASVYHAPSSLPGEGSGDGLTQQYAQPGQHTNIPLGPLSFGSEATSTFIRLPSESLCALRSQSNCKHLNAWRDVGRSGRKRSNFPNIRYWTKDEAMSDPQAHSNPNVRKPTLKVIAEGLDGQPVDDSRFADIQAHVRTACTRCLDLNLSWTKQTPSCQDSYIGYVEQLAPELSYCDDSGWKAVMMARTFLDGKTRRNRDISAGVDRKPRISALISGGKQSSHHEGGQSAETSARANSVTNESQDFPVDEEKSDSSGRKRKRVQQERLPSPDEYPVVCLILFLKSEVLLIQFLISLSMFPDVDMAFRLIRVVVDTMHTSTSTTTRQVRVKETCSALVQTCEYSRRGQRTNTVAVKNRQAHVFTVVIKRTWTQLFHTFKTQVTRTSQLPTGTRWMSEDATDSHRTLFEGL